MLEDDQCRSDEDSRVEWDTNEAVEDESVEVLKIETSADFWRVQIESIYRRRNPYKLENVPEFLKKYEGQEAILYTKVCRKYDLDPTKWYADPRSWQGEEEDIKPEDEMPDVSTEEQTPFIFGQQPVTMNLTSTLNSGLLQFGSVTNPGQQFTLTDLTPAVNEGLFQPGDTMSPTLAQDVSDSDEVNSDGKKRSKRKRRSKGKVSLQDTSEDTSEDLEAPHADKKAATCRKRVIKESHKFKKAKPHAKAK